MFWWKAHIKGYIKGFKEGWIAAQEEQQTSPTNLQKPLICECGDHITGDYAFVDGKYLCPICMTTGNR